MMFDAEYSHPVVITGSYNFTVAAQKYNAENMGVFNNNSEIATKFRENWLKHQKHSPVIHKK